MKKIISILLVLISLFTFTACSDNNNNDNSGSNPNEPVVDQVLTPNYILYNGVTDYKIVLSDNANDDEKTAKDELQTLFSEATGIDLPIISDEGLTHNADNKYICIGDNDLFRSANITLPEKASGIHGYYLYTKDNTIYIYGNQKLGNRFGVYNFLYRIVGFEQYSYDCYWIDKAVTEIPLYNYTAAHSPHYYNYGAFAGFMRQYPSAMYRMLSPETDKSIFGLIEGQKGHNTLILLKPEEYKQAHPKWYSYPDAQQLCYTAQGDEAERELLVQTAIENLIEHMKKMPDRYIWQLSNMDVGTTCGCEKCRELKEIYGCPTAQWIWFGNDVYNGVKEYLNTAEAKEYFNDYFIKNFKLSIGFYWGYIEAPSVKNSSGQFVPIENDDYPSVVMEDGIVGHVAPIDLLFQRSTYHPENKVYYEQLSKIAALCTDMDFWAYSTNFHAYMYPYDMFNSMQENYQIWHNEFHVTSMTDEIQNGNFLGMPAWHMLTAALSARLGNDIYLDQEAYIQRYFRGYFLDAAEPMMKYFNSLRAHTVLQLKENPKMGDCYYNIKRKELWPKANIDKWQGYVAEAMEIIEKYKYTDRETYDMLYRHISLERTFLDYVYLFFYSSNIGSQYSTIAQRFAYDCQINKIMTVAEGNSIQGFIDNIMSEI